MKESHWLALQSSQMTRPLTFEKYSVSKGAWVPSLGPRLRLCKCLSHRACLMNYIGSANGTQLHFLYLSQKMLTWQQHTVDALTYAVCAVIRTVHCLVKMEQCEDRNIEQAEGGFFIIVSREQSDWCNKRNAERERSSSFSHSCVLFSA